MLRENEVTLYQSLRILQDSGYRPLEFEGTEVFL